MGNAREELRTHIAFHHSTGPAGDLQGQAKSTTVIFIRPRKPRPPFAGPQPVARPDHY